MHQHTHTQDEHWKPVSGWGDVYEVSDQGRVRSKPRIVLRSDGETRRLKGRVLRASRANSTNNRYRSVGLSKDGKLYMKRVHLLVAEAFIGPRPEGMVLRHLNDDTNDNRLANLAYGTIRDNSRDSVQNGTHMNTKKTHCLRGHHLSGTNLTNRREGHRDCRSCTLARKSLIRRFGEYTEAQLQELSDQRYLELAPLS